MPHCEPSGKPANRYLIRQPKALQYFHNGELVRASEGERQAGRFELFLDLLYVAIVANFADNLATHPTGAQLVKYILIFTPAWHIWSMLKQLMNSHYNDDISQRILILWIMTLLVIYGNNATLVDEDISAMRTTVGAYIVARLTEICVYSVYSFASHYHRIQTWIFASLVLVGLILWMPLFFETVSLRSKVAVAVVAILYEQAIWLLSFGPWIKRRLGLTYSTALDISHEVDRCAAFFIIVLGEYLYTSIVLSPAAIGLNLRALRAVWTLVIAFCLNWLYVNGDGAVRSTHPLHRAVWSAFTWILMHLPLNMALLIGGHICAVSVGKDKLGRGERWLWGGGLGVGLVVLWGIAMCFRSEDEPGLLWFPKIIRMLPRLVVALVLALLPLASPERLDPTQLLSITAGLFVFLVLWETVGSLERGAGIFEPWTETEVEQEGEVVLPVNVVDAEKA
ncbi:hypothetical protein K432DRAFT_344825 [Lepidopterella palustris CBS 459.81]|uniref:Low temperature requirement protein A n=1 Tax=Lepidopterella palustris CBS 459.81 TaxID=1314670 RepID=A0A8E2JJF4_9PEZI|nr:hypothetical protein K432DRAFT_344825 [Lepidopterella palustris CBS 459.81]